MPGIAPWYCREKRVAIWVEVETALGSVQVINSHFGLGRLERVLQAQWLVGEEWLGSLGASAPAVLLGDFNSIRRSRAYRILAGILRDVRTLVQPRGAYRTYPTRRPILAVDHIFVNAALHAASLGSSSDAHLARRFRPLPARRRVERLSLKLPVTADGALEHLVFIGPQLLWEFRLRAIPTFQP